MIYIELKDANGETMKFSRIAMGSSMSMEMLSTEEKFRLYDYFIDRGGNTIDTARAYGDGHSEEMVGEYLQSRGNRSRLMVCSKGGHPMQSAPDVKRVNRACIMADLEQSLKVLHTDYLDMYWIHKDGPEVPIEEIVDIMEDIVKSGKARRVGVSNYDTYRVKAAVEYAESKGSNIIGGSQIGMSLAASEDKYFVQFGSLMMTPDKYAYYEEKHIPVFAFSSQAQGFFARVAAQGLDAMPPYLRESYGSAENMKRLARVQQMAEEKHASIPAVGLAHIIFNRLPVVAIVGAENTEMLGQSLDAAELNLTPEEADWLYRV